MPIGGNGGITLIEQLCEVSRSNSWPLRRALTSTGRGYRQDGRWRRTGRVIPQESAEGAAATRSVSNLTKALKEAFG